MTTRQLLKELLEVARSNYGEDEFSTRMLKQQIASMEREPRSAEGSFMTAPWARRTAGKGKKE